MTTRLTAMVPTPTTQSPKFLFYKSCLIVLLLAFVPVQTVRADIGPKPTMSFTFVWETEGQPAIVDGQLIQCEDAECSESYPLESMGPQHFTCTDTACDSMAYGYSAYAKLVLNFADDVTRESNIFAKKYDKSQYEVMVRSSDLVVSEARGSNLSFITPDSIGSILHWLGILLGLGALPVLLALSILTIVKTRKAPLLFENARLTCISVWVITLPALILGILFAQTLPLTLFIEGILISIYTYFKKQKWFPWATIIMLGNLLTQVLLLTATALTGTHGMPLLFTMILEIFIWLLEAVLIHLTLRRQHSILQSLGISLVLNAVSMSIGFALPL